ncbi:MAG: hypothetical protein IAA89_02910 [Firmicutes bacterium]|uniref:DUF4825 domain-containing protein n=1 Tax=Candidatus Gallilactobacillus intestinavium TaxID=2840838 RepID=A0A9D9E7X4_9LACO|nr:hypothetical protein [Candidatus Gallilactobacillus intestinavium]
MKKRKRAKLITLILVITFTLLSLGAVAVTTINAGIEHHQHESKLKKMSEKAAKVLPKEAYKPGVYKLKEKKYFNNYKISAELVVNDKGIIKHVEFDQLDQFNFVNPQTSTEIDQWNSSLLRHQDLSKLSCNDSNQTDFFNLYKKYMKKLINMAHSGKVNYVVINNEDN